MNNNFGKILITGGTGFVGKSLQNFFLERNINYSLALRNIDSVLNRNIEIHGIGDINLETDWSEALEEVDVVIHLAGQAHFKKIKSKKHSNIFDVNTDGTISLAKKAAEKGVKRFIFLSSIKVNGEVTMNGKCFRSSDAPAPKDAYGESKRLAEEGLIKVSRETGMNFIILRPPLILGNNAKGNLGLIELLNFLRLPIPFGGINSNVRSYITIDLLNRILLQCISSEKALNRVILIREKSMISTSKLIKLVFSENRRKSPILKINERVLRKFLRLFKLKNFENKLLNNLEIDDSEMNHIFRES